MDRLKNFKILLHYFNNNNNNFYNKILIIIAVFIQNKEILLIIIKKIKLIWKVLVQIGISVWNQIMKAIVKIYL